MKASTKKSLIVVVALASLACLVMLGVVLRSRPDEPTAVRVSDASRSPSFEVHVVKPRLARFLFGILPTKLEDEIFGGGELRFDHASRGARIGRIGHDRLELSADGWNLFVEIDGEGRIAPGTRLVFPMLLAEKQRTLRCRPAERGVGHLRTTARVDSDELDGSFLVELAICENAESGKVIEYPPAPLTVRGSFGALPHSRQ